MTYSGSRGSRPGGDIPRPGRKATWIGVALVAALFFGLCWLWAASFVSTDGGHVAVIRNGGPFDNHRIRDVIQPGSSIKYEGQYSVEHSYPASQRYYTITGDKGAGDRAGVDVFTGSSSEGTPMSIEGSIQFTLVTDNKRVSVFDDRYGTRTFPDPITGKRLYPWEGDEGWSTFLDAVVRRQVIDNALREQIQSHKCIELIPACQYVNGAATLKKGAVAKGDQANANLVAIQTAISKTLQSDLDSTLGGHFIQVDSFRIAKAELPQELQRRIIDANAAKVEIQKQALVADQKVAAARGEKRANEQKAADILALNRAYAKSKAKAQIDAIHEFVQGIKDSQITTLVMGGGSGTILNLGKGGK